MKFDPVSRRWNHLSPIPGHSFGADLNCDLGLSRPTAFGVKFALAGDFDGDGRQELVVAPDVPGTGGNDFWVMKFDPAARRWSHLSPIPGHGFGADLNCDLGLSRPTAFGVKFALAGDFDGDGQQELVVAPDVPGTAGNDFWVMKFDPAARRWRHLSPIAGHGADLNCDLGLAHPTAFGVKFALAGDFDGDGRQELAVAPDVPRSAGNDFWVMKFDPVTRRWNHLSPIAGHGFGADLNCDLGFPHPTAVGVKFALAGRFSPVPSS